jgi:hypothetical protein
MKRMKKAVTAMLLLVSAVAVAGGCLSVKTEHEIKPIHITLDVNLKVQKELEDFLNFE